MNDIGLTHIESLDSDRVTIPGLDVDAALASTIALGAKKIRQRRIITTFEGCGALVLVVVLLSGTIHFLSDTSGSPHASRVATKTLSKVPTKVLAKTQTNTVPATVAINQTPVAPQVTTPTPHLVSILHYGDSSLCTPPASSPDGSGVDVGTSQSLDKWNPAANETKIISAGSTGHDIVLTNTQNASATNGQYVDLTSGFDRNSSYADVSTFGFTYCESGYKLTITPEAPGQGYLLTTEGW